MGNADTEVIFLNYLWVLLSSVFAVAYLFLVTKLLGYRQIAQLSPFDYINGISIGSIAANMATDPENWLEYLIAIGVFGGLTLLFSFLTDKFMCVRRLVSGTPLVLLDHGKLYDDNFRRGKIDINEFLTMCRAAGYFDLSSVGTAILEENGALSVFPKSTDRPLTATDLGLSPPADELPVAVIIDGEIMKQNLKGAGKEEKWLRAELSRQRYSHLKDVFLATLTESGKLTVFPRGGAYQKDLFE